MSAENIEEIARLRGKRVRDILDLSSDVNPIGTPKPAIAAIKRELARVSEYPDGGCFKLRQKLARYEGTKPENIVVGNGANELVSNIIRALKPKNAIVFTPTFCGYERALQSVGCNVNFAPLYKDENFSYYIPDLTGVDLVFICSPNNPTGSVAEADVIKGILDRGVTVIADLSFEDFHGKYLKISAANFIKVKSAAKIFALAGLGIGYAVVRDEVLLAEYGKAAPNQTVNRLAQAALLACLDDVEHIKKSADFVKREGERIYYDLVSRQGITPHFPTANFLLFESSIPNLYEGLLSANILVCRCTALRGLGEDWYRIAVKSAKLFAKRFKIS